MTDDKIREVLDRYEARINHMLGSGNISRSRATVKKRERLRHLRDMIPKMRGMLDTSALLTAHREKLMRWLGFMQGALWVKGIYTIDELKAHNRPDDGAQA